MSRHPIDQTEEQDSPDAGVTRTQAAMDVLIEEADLRGKTGVFQDRRQAGLLLAQQLRALAEPQSIVLAIPAGGVPVACSLARDLGLELDVVVARKLQIPGNKEAGFGAIGPSGEILLHERIVDDLKLSAKEINHEVDETRQALKQRELLFRRKKPFPQLKDRQVILVDDGLATGYTMLAAAHYVRQQEARQVIVASPTASQRTVNFLLPKVDMLVCLNIRGGPVFAVADAYASWFDVEDEEALKLLLETQAAITPPAPT